MMTEFTAFQKFALASLISCTNLLNCKSFSLSNMQSPASHMTCTILLQSNKFLSNLCKPAKCPAEVNRLSYRGLVASQSTNTELPPISPPQ
jgi:hypothetical protein